LLHGSCCMDLAAWILLHGSCCMDLAAWAKYNLFVYTLCVCKLFAYCLQISQYLAAILQHIAKNTAKYCKYWSYPALQKL